jgi:DNA-binding transcriptional ArsR family regulator
MVNGEALSNKARGVMTDVVAERIIDDVATLKALADPIRMTLLELTMGEPERTWTARELAAVVGVLPTNIYYHLNLLERHDLLMVRDTRVVNGIIEKHYGPGQHSISFHRRSGEAEGLRDMAKSMLEQTRDDIDAGLALGTMSANRDAPEPQRLTLSRAIVRIPADEIADFRQELIDMVERYESRARKGRHQFTVIAAIYPS